MAAPVPDAGGCEAPGQGTPVHRLEFSFRSRLPVILQNEVSECALACLAMIACWHGHRTTLTELRRRFSPALTGTTLRSLADIAGGLGLGCRSLRLEIEDFGRLQTPAMLHWRLDHFVVLKAVCRRGIVVHDPARGKRRIGWGEVSRCFTGVAVEFCPSRGFERKQAPERLRLGDLWERSKGLYGTLAQIVLLSAILQLAALIAPLVNQLVVDEAIAKRDSGFLEAILVGFGLLLGCQVVIEIMRSSVAVYLGQMLAFRLRSNLLRHLFSLPAAFFEKRHLGDVMSRIGAMSGIERLLSSAVVTVLIDGALAATTLTVMLVYSPTLALMVAGAGVLALVARLAAFPYLRRLTEEQVYADAELQTVLLESIRGIRAVKLFGRESQRHDHWQSAFVDASNVGIELQRFGIVAAAGSRLLSGGLDLAVFFVGAMQVIGGGMSLGMLFAFQAHRAQFAARSGALITLYFDYRTLSIDLERLADIVHAEAECRPGDVGPFATPLTGRIELVDARFRYADDQPWILDGASLRIADGDRVALTGASGSGKSTLVKILLGLLPLADGAVLYDGIPLTAAGLRDVRRQIGVVMQDDRLLSGTLAENICFFDDEPDMARIVSAARQAGIDADIRRMPMGYLSFVGDMGSALSGGQKQRLLLARALYRRPRILILDEGTANLDEATEHGVFDALGALGVTQLIVAHRPAAIAACNRIVRIADGAITEIDAPGRG